RDAQGQLRYVIGAGIDVTQEHRLEEQRRQAPKMEALGTLVGGLAHDFNNHLTVILGTLSLSLADLGEAGVPNGNRTPSLPVRLDEIRAQLREVERAALHCAEITNQLLTFRQGHGGEKQVIDLGQLVRDTVEVLQRELPDTIEVSAQVAPGSGSVLADRTQLQQAFLHLARNACDAMPQGGRLSFHLLPRLLDERDAASNLEASAGKVALVRVRAP